MRYSGFTLAEVLIALALLGVLAALTIPRLLVGSDNQSNLTKTKQAAFAVTQAFNDYRKTHRVTGTTAFSDLYSSLNTLEVGNISARVDVSPNWPYTGNASPPNDQGSWNCSTYAQAVCMRFPSGAVLFTDRALRLGSGPNAAFVFHVDPDGQASAVKSVAFCLYRDGSLKDSSTCLTNTTWVGTGGATFSVDPVAGGRPDWFNW